MFKWKSEMEIGILIIDQQHQHLFELGNQIISLIEKNQSTKDVESDLLILLDDLKQYTFYHFKTEEDLFIKYNYKDYKSHKKEHDLFKEYIFNVNPQNIRNEEFLYELLEKIFTWITNHIISSDYMYKDHLHS